MHAAKSCVKQDGSFLYLDWMDNKSICNKELYVEDGANFSTQVIEGINTASYNEFHHLDKQMNTDAESPERGNHS